MYIQPESIDSHVVFDQTRHPALRIYRDYLTMPSGTELSYNRIEQNHGQPGVLVMPVRFRDGAIGLVKQYRYPVKTYHWELPRGFVPAQKETTVQSAVRELREETGLVCSPSSMSPLGVCCPDSGILTTQVDMYAALIEDSNNPATRHEDTEEISAFAWFSRKDVMASVANGDITDGFTLSALMKLESDYDAIVSGQRALVTEDSG